MNTVHSIPFQDIYSQLDVEEDDYDYYGELEMYVERERESLVPQ